VLPSEGWLDSIEPYHPNLSFWTQLFLYTEPADRLRDPAVAPTLPLLVVLLGPTASGKTSLSLQLAEQLHGEILSCDSVAVYRGLEIGSAKPTPAERARIAHHLIDIATPDHPYTAGDYGRDARAAVADITARGCTPIVSGGTGLYLRALLEGLFAGPRRSEPLRNRLRATAARHQERPGEGHQVTSWLHRLLNRIDPASAARIHPNDQPKLIRALEVSLATRQPLSTALADAAARDPLQGYRILRIGLQPDRAALYARINQRAAAMFEHGLIEETRALLAQYQPKPAALDALGYRQAALVLSGELSLEQAITAAQHGHRNYAKRQLTWFRREPDVHWLAGFGHDSAIAAEALSLVSHALTSSA
jgi:tRNA dimethylallyltransferase